MTSPLSISHAITSVFVLSLYVRPCLTPGWMPYFVSNFSRLSTIVGWIIYCLIQQLLPLAQKYIPILKLLLIFLNVFKNRLLHPFIWVVASSTYSNHVFYILKRHSSVAVSWPLVVAWAYSANLKHFHAYSYMTMQISPHLIITLSHLQRLIKDINFLVPDHTSSFTTNDINMSSMLIEHWYTLDRS